MTSDGDPLPEPAVSPDVYTDEYYRTACAGAVEWEASGGAQVSGIYHGVLHLSGFKPGEVLVDFGAGRGELVALAVEQGAARAVGVEYADVAMRLAEQTFAARGVADRAEMIFGDARAVPLEDGTADLVTFVDVVEHLTDAELRQGLREGLRVLKRGGRIFVHTMPNRSIYEITYRLQRLARPGRRKRWPKDPRLPYEQQMHVNEQSKRTLTRYLRDAGFADVRVWLPSKGYNRFVPDEAARRLYRVLAKIPFTRRLGSFDLFATARKP